MKSILLTQLILTNKIYNRLGRHNRHNHLGLRLKIACFALFGFAPFILSAATIDDLQFTLINNETEYSVSAIDFSFAGAIDIPATYNNKPVTAIGRSGFYLRSALTSITLPDSITSIEDNAFRGCTSLTSINLPDTITSIGEYAFNDCSALTSITLPNALTSIRDYTFAGCSALTSITLPEGVTSVGSYAIRGCSSLTSITLPDSITSIGDSAFNGCSSLTSITLPNELTSIEESTFIGCTSLTSITLPDSITSIGSYAFKGCSSLTSITLPEGVTSIENFTFSHCTALTSITLPKGLTSIGRGAFSSSTSLASITLPEGVTYIGEYAFHSCNKLASMTFLGEAPTLGGSYIFIGAGRDVESGLVVTVYDTHQDSFATWPDLYFVSLNVVDAVEPPVVTSFIIEASYDPNHNSFSIISRNEASGATVSLQHTDSLHEEWATLDSSDYTETVDTDAGTVIRTVILELETNPQGFYRLISE